MNEPLLNVKALSVRRAAQPILNHLSFELNPGETLALVGESGSGKSLTALSLMRILPTQLHIDPDSVIHLKGENICAYSEIQLRNIRARQIAMVFQEASAALNPVFSIGEQIGEVIKHHFNIGMAKRRKRVDALLEKVDLEPPARFRQSYPHQLSGGQRQRALIAMALAGEPGILIADEPTTALDVTTQSRILTLLQTLQAQYCMGILFITHDLNLVRHFADKIAVMQGGEIVEMADTVTLFERPQHSYTKELLAMTPGVTPRASELPEVKPKPILTVKDLCVHYPIRKGILKRIKGYVQSVNHVSFQVDNGQTVALVGESGSGKTTLAKSILRLVPVTSGSVHLNDTNVSELKGAEVLQLRRQVQVIFQDPYASLNPRMMIHDIVAEGLRALKMLTDKTEIKQRVVQLLEQVGLDTAALWRYPHEFSGGQRQRIAIARALAVQPKLLICDEPTSALDWSVQMKLIDLLKSLQNEFQLSCLLITHDLAVVSELAHEMVVIKEGQVIEQGPSHTILNQPQHPYTQQLIAARFGLNTTNRV